MSRGHGKPTEITPLEIHINKLLENVRTDQQYQHISLKLFTEWVIDFCNERDTEYGDWGNEDLFREYVDDQLARLNRVTATDVGNVRLFPNEIDFLLAQELVKLNGVDAGSPAWDLANALASIRQPKVRQTRRRRRTAPHRAVNLRVPTQPLVTPTPVAPLVILARPPIPHQEAPILRGMLTQGAPAPGTVLFVPAASTSQPGPSAPGQHPPGTVLVGAAWRSQPGPSAPAQPAPARRGRAQKLDAVVDRISSRLVPAADRTFTAPEAPAALPDAVAPEVPIKEEEPEDVPASLEPEAPAALPEPLPLQAPIKEEAPAALPEALLLQAPIKEEEPEAFLLQAQIKEEEPETLPEALAPEAHIDFLEDPDADLEPLEPDELAALREDAYADLLPYDPEEFAALPEDHAPEAIAAPEADAPIEADAPVIPIQEEDSIQAATAAREQEEDFSEDSEVFGSMVFRNEDHYKTPGWELPPAEDSEDKQEAAIQPSQTRSSTPAAPLQGALVQAPAAAGPAAAPVAAPATPEPAAPATPAATPQRKRGRKPKSWAVAPTSATPATPAATPQRKRGRKPKSQAAAPTPAAPPVKRGRPKKTKEEESELQDCFVCPGCKLPAGLTGKKESTDYRCGWCLCWYHAKHTTWTEWPKYEGQYWCANCDKLPDDDGSRKLRKRKATEPPRRSAQIRGFDNLSKYSTKRKKEVEEDDDEEVKVTPKRRKTTATTKRSQRRQ
ncbi:hypothetical protein L5515_016638 [Caenorhabditis briggsae]|uniref:Uncharacterized protein n=1 Tax=Caenorhabditis briggsae TaxID=6238 RepID=A0AAE9FB88_CAEBR|nr:hypothetical protein L5515_016638 [Caenorhabditis briggsae]